MAVATQLGAAFQKFCDQVTQAMEKNTNIKLKPVLGSLEDTLNSLRDEIIQPIQQGHQIFDDQNDKIESIVVELHKGAKLIAKVSKLRSWKYFWLDEDKCRWRLGKLELYLIGLLPTTRYRAFIGTIFGAYKKAVEAGKVPSTAEERESGEEEEATLVVFRRLFEALREAEEKREAPLMFRFLVWDIRNKMIWLLRLPFLMHNKPKLFTSSSREKMEEGLEVVRRSSSGVWNKWRLRKTNKFDTRTFSGLVRLHQHLSLCLDRRVRNALQQGLDLSSS